MLNDFGISECKTFRVIFTTCSAISHIDIKAVDWSYNSNNDLQFSNAKINDDEDDAPNDKLVASFDGDYVIGVIEEGYINK